MRPAKCPVMILRIQRLGLVKEYPFVRHWHIISFMDQELLRLYENLKSERDIRASYITPKAGETNHLEFKQKTDTRGPSLSEQDKYNFSKVVSSFSNADGGLLVWGISSRRTDGRDHASALKPIKQVNTFAESLRDSLIDSVMPRNHKVAIKAIANRQGNGFVICMVPAADDVPIRAMNADREYWVRTDGRTMKLEHYQIRDMMLRHAHPDLDLDVVAVEQGLPPDQIKLDFRLHNKGKSLAKYWGYFIRMPAVSLLGVDQCSDVSSLNPGTPSVSHDGGFNSVIHPNGIRIGVGGMILQKAAEPQNIAIRAQWYCEDMSAKERMFTFLIPAASNTQE